MKNTQHQNLFFSQIKSIVLSLTLNKYSLCILTLFLFKNINAKKFNHNINSNDFLYTTANSSIGDYIWFDENGDGIQDSSESPIGNIMVTLIFPDSSTTTQITDSLGFYEFTGLAADTYTVTIGEGLDTILFTPDSYTIILTENEAYIDADFSFDDIETIGCTDSMACNYSATAIIDNGSCDYSLLECPDSCNAILGCIDSTACNFDLKFFELWTK